jgi:MtN3 and saliva related transmembrane protein
MTDIELIGFAAALMTSASYMPQVWRILSTGETGGISLLMYALLTTGKLCWLSYGILIASIPLIASQSFTILLAALILGFTARERLGLNLRRNTRFYRNWKYG